MHYLPASTPLKLTGAFTFVESNQYQPSDDNNETGIATWLYMWHPRTLVPQVLLLSRRQHSHAQMAGPVLGFALHIPLHMHLIASLLFRCATNAGMFNTTFPILSYNHSQSGRRVTSGCTTSPLAYGGKPTAETQDLPPHWNRWHADQVGYNLMLAALLLLLNQEPKAVERSTKKENPTQGRQRERNTRKNRPKQ